MFIKGAAQMKIDWFNGVNRRHRGGSVADSTPSFDRLSVYYSVILAKAPLVGCKCEPASRGLFIC